MRLAVRLSSSLDCEAFGPFHFDTGCVSLRVNKDVGEMAEIQTVGHYVFV